MENQPFLMEISKPLARSAMKRDGLPADIKNTEEEVLVSPESHLDNIEKKE